MQTIPATLCAVLFLAAGCDSGSVSSAEDARRAYLGFDSSIDKAITLGFDGFNSAQSANIAPQTANGLVSGKLTVTGQVDQGASSNKTMRLAEELVTYSDDGKITYVSTPGALPMLTMDLKSIPTGTLDGTLNGTLTMSGDLQGALTVALMFTGALQPSADMSRVERKPGTTHVTGTATSSAGTYQVDVTR